MYQGSREIHKHCTLWASLLCCLMVLMDVYFVRGGLICVHCKMCFDLAEDWQNVRRKVEGRLGFVGCVL